MGVPTDLPHENRVSQLAKNTDKQSVAATNRSEEGLDIPKSRKKLVSYIDLASWIGQCTCLRQAGLGGFARLIFFILAKAQRRKGIERSLTNLSPSYRRQ